MEKEAKKKLRTSLSLYQKKKPRNTMCTNCPHQNEVRTKSCSMNDLEGFALEEPHVCTWHPDQLCRGCVEKMIMNDKKWNVLSELQQTQLDKKENGYEVNLGKKRLRS